MLRAKIEDYKVVAREVGLDHIRQSIRQCKPNVTYGTPDASPTHTLFSRLAVLLR